MADDNGKKDRYLTTGEKIRNFTGWAFAVAVLIELVALPFYHQYGNTETQSTEPPIHIEHQTIKPPPTPPPPTPTPPPTPQPHQTPQPQQHQQQPTLKVHQIHLQSQGQGPSYHAYSPPPHGSYNGTQTGTSTASPAPAATPASCPDPNREAHVVEQAQADYPQSAEELGLGDVTVEVKVTVGPSGELVSEEIYQSGHNAEIDREALRVARASTYAPKLVNCAPTTGDYLFDVEFTPS